MKKIAVTLGIVLGIALFPSTMVMAAGGIDVFQAYVKALDMAWSGLVEYNKLILELFQTAIG